MTKFLLCILIILNCVTSKLHAQGNKDISIKVIFKPKSTKLSKIEKEKIRVFSENNSLDSTWQYEIYICRAIHVKNMKISWERLCAVISFMEQSGIKRNRCILPLHYDNCSMTNDILIKKVIKEEIIPPPFPNLTK